MKFLPSFVKRGLPSGCLASCKLFLPFLGFLVSSLEARQNSFEQASAAYADVAPVLAIIHEGRSPQDVPIWLLNLPARSPAPEESIQAVLETLAQPFHANYEEDEAGAIFNELINFLLRHEPLPKKLGDTLASVALTESATPTIRDYALQELAYVWPRTEDPADRRTIESALWEVAQKYQSEISGSALLTLSRIWTADKEASMNAHLLRLDTPPPVRLYPGDITIVSKEDYLAHVLKVLPSSEAALNARLASLRVGLMFQLPEMQKLILQIVNSNTAPSHLRIAAIAALPGVASPDVALTVITPFANHLELGPAARNALAVLKKGSSAAKPAQQQ